MTPDGRKQTGKLNIIDLAGSEKVGASENTETAKAEGTVSFIHSLIVVL